MNSTDKNNGPQSAGPVPPGTRLFRLIEAVAHGVAEDLAAPQSDVEPHKGQEPNEDSSGPSER
jgi:hypothetical protein